MTQIKAAYFTGDKSFEIRRIEARPPASGEVQIDIAFCGICGTDMHIFHGAMAERLGGARVIGHEMSGTVAAIGPDVDMVSVGRKVVVRPLDHCGDCPACAAGHEHICHNLKFLGIDTDGGFQEKWTVPAHTVHVLPDTLPLDQAALIEPLAVACHDVARGKTAKGENALVIGGGPIGILVAMAARSRGANVILSEVNPHRLEIAARLGFDTVNPAESDLAETVRSKTGGKGADVVFEVSGSQAGVDAMTTAIAVRGRIVMVAIHPTAPRVDLFQFFWRELELFGARVYRPEDYETAIAMIAAGEIDTSSMITNISALEDIQSAFEALESSPTAMKSLIRVSGS